MKIKKIVVSMMVLVMALTSVAIPSTAKAADLTPYVTKAVADYKAGGYVYAPYLQDYTPYNDYLNFSKKNIKPDGVRLDYEAGTGLPLVKYSSGWFHNPVTTENVALTHWGRYINTGDPAERDAFLQLADGLISLQSSDGSFHYEFDFSKPEWNYTFKAGWVSGMAQGEALSVFARAWKETGDTKYLTAGFKSLQFMQRSIYLGGTMYNLSGVSSSFSNLIWFEEYPTPDLNKTAYTLNGFMFTMLGLYDWSQIPASAGAYAQDQAVTLFPKTVASLREMIRRYDIGGFTMYDYSYYTMQLPEPHIVPSYHAVHIYQLQAIYSITRDRYFLDKAYLFEDYVR